MIELKDKDIFDQFFKSDRYEGSECTFTNLYMWRKTYNITWTLVDDFLCVKATLNDATYVLPPFPRNKDGFFKVVDKLIDYIKEINIPFVMGGITEDLMAYMEKERPNMFNFTEDFDTHDYVYSAEDLVELKGRKYSRKRNHIKNFKKHYSDYEYFDMTEELVPSCIQSAIDWCEKKEKDFNDKRSLICERDALIEALKQFTYLGFKGGVIKVNDKVEAFTFGELLNEDTAVIHVEKGNRELNGIYPTINQDFCIRNWSEIKFINREEDLGLPGLKKAKESYYPVKFIKKYSATLKNEG
ncbi:hypothetical protein SAMN00017405_1812 [Desulfonispora thiosulfatigenes DSM 11270]|uniref:Phosphatidylglycerol lysyltransferase C-terminal domain-containing protein n=1 Tax=Desulfonispora thiosulfatigenes DSM 11270 TaxID=656914 RepID=A0A1W1V3M4_DESTI|nr:phosphatidylglycerol lysyltransferase domain-containing protein [Desulfonispora thiosulfatigenes]SMB88007.1 hypothetical protein SAMN00017405_1812 [Desulfonispora thiosulfatigenes DSM 11270]